MATAEEVPASEVKAGDVLALPGAPHSTVTGVLTYNLGQGAADWPVLHIQGEHNIIRFPHECLFRIIPSPVADD